MATHTDAFMPPEYSLVALTEPGFAAVLVREAKRAVGDRRTSKDDN